MNNFKSNAKGKHLERSKQAYIEFVALLETNNHVLKSEYINNSTKVLIDFNCEHEPHWIRPNHYKRGHGCPKCSNHCPEQAKQEFIELLKNNNHVLKSEYVNATTKVLIDFNCDHEFHWLQPNSYKNGIRCPKCSNNCPEQAKQNLIELLKNNNHVLKSTYVNTETKVLIDFNCGHESHWIRPNDYKKGNRCPLCKNKGEAALHKLIQGMNYIVETQKTYNDLKDKQLLRYDFYLPEFNLLIELDGDHHREAIIYKSKNIAISNLEDRIRKDKIKDDYAINNNINLLRIEYNNGKVDIQKWEQLIKDKINEITNQK